MLPDPQEPAIHADAAPAAAAVYRYKAHESGDFVPGVPARDLLEADLIDVDVAELEACGLYEKVVNSVG